MNYPRILQLNELLKKKSFFLLGPRATGKTFLIRQQLAAESVMINLLKGDVFLRLAAHPEDLEAVIDAAIELKKKKYIVIDEVQKVPALLDEVQRLIEERRLKFLLTGSSARKLKAGNANLLAGRAWTAHFFPLSWSEIPDFDLNRYLMYGGLPSVWSSEHPREELNAYVQTYLREEIQAEGLVRRLPQFSRFLEVAALASGQLINYAQIASDSSVPASTVKGYFSILEDTLIGFHVLPWTASTKRKAIETSKFYLFDPGVTHVLAQTRTLDRNSDLYGRSFEQWIAMELRAYLSYRRKEDALTFWRSTHGDEVDFIVGGHTAIEVKSTRRVSDSNLKGLKRLEEEKKMQRYILVSHDPVETQSGALQCIHWKTWVSRLWEDCFF